MLASSAGERAPFSSTCRPQYTDRHGRGRAGGRDHSFIRTACLPKSETCYESANQPCGAPRLLANPTRGQETSTSCRRFHFFPAELHRKLGGAFGDSLHRMRWRIWSTIMISTLLNARYWKCEAPPAPAVDEARVTGRAEVIPLHQNATLLRACRQSVLSLMFVAHWMMGKRYLCCTRTERFTLNLASKYVDGPYQTQTGI
jgi:hypothetical protein